MKFFVRREWIVEAKDHGHAIDLVGFALAGDDIPKVKSMRMEVIPISSGSVIIPEAPRKCDCLGCRET